MKTLICATNQSLNLSKFSPWKPKFSSFPKKPLTTLKPHASSNSKGFSSSKPSTIKTNDITTMNKNPNNKEDEDEIPKVVLYRIIGRILFSVLVPMALGLSFLHLYGELKDRQIWNAPLWVPFLTTLITFGASSLGIAYGVLSSSLDEEREGTLFGLQEVEKNWVEMWKEEDAS